MAEGTQVQLAPHWHECPVVGCHVKYECHSADCARFTFKNCAKHEVVDKPSVVMTSAVESPPAES